MKIKGRFLKFESIISSNHYFPRNCEIDIPEKMPLLFNFEQSGLPLGTVTVERDNDGLTMTADIALGAEELIKAFKDEVGIGGFYNNLKTRTITMMMPSGFAVIRRIDKCSLKAVALTPSPVDPSFKYDIVYEENLHAEDNKNE